MRFVISGEWTRNHLLKTIIIFFLAYLFFFWWTNLFLFLTKLGFSYESVVDYFRGSEERYMQPRSLQGLLEVSHFHLFAMGILMLTMTHLILFVPFSIKTKMFYICAAFSSAFLDEASGWLIRFVAPEFAWLKLISFSALQIVLALLMLFVLRALIFEQPSAYTDGLHAKRHPHE